MPAPPHDGSDEPAVYAPDWYADPTGRATLRYYDGSAWTDHVVIDREQQIDDLHSPAAPPAPEPQTEGLPDPPSAGLPDPPSAGLPDPPSAGLPDPPAAQAGGHDGAQSAMDMIQSKASGLGDYILSGGNATKFTGNQARWEGGGHITNEPILLVEEDASYLKTSNEYEVKSHEGVVLGRVRQVGQSGAKQAARALTSFDRHMTHQYEVLDAEGRLVLRLTRPAKVMKSKVIIEDASGQQIGSVVQENVVGRIRFALEAGGGTVGRISGKNWSKWDFVISDASGTEVGRINKSFSGLGKAMLAGGDNYVVAMHQPLPDPLRLMVVASGVCIDTALHQDSGSARRTNRSRRGRGPLRF